MKNLFKNSVYAAAALVLALGAASCSDSDGDYTFADEREEALKDAAVDFVDNNVIPTYKALADGSIALQEDCEAMLEAFDAGTLTTPLVQAACNDWITTRKHWELSEAYLYGAAADYDIDPHIDSWPLDGTALQNLLNNNSMMAEIERNPDYVSANLGYGLLGFHALEYMLFENAGPRALGKYTRPQLVYLVGVANDLCNMCVRLEASWAGLDNVTEEKQTILGDAELEPTFDYGASMRNSGKGGSKYRNYKDAADPGLHRHRHGGRLAEDRPSGQRNQLRGYQLHRVALQPEFEDRFHRQHHQHPEHLPGHDLRRRFGERLDRGGRPRPRYGGSQCDFHGDRKDPGLPGPVRRQPYGTGMEGCRHLLQ